MTNTSQAESERHAFQTHTDRGNKYPWILDILIEFWIYATTRIVDKVKVFGNRIKHVHWKDMGAEWEEKRGTMFGCGMGMIPLGDGVVGIQSIVDELLKIGFDGPTTLEVAGQDAVLTSATRLREWSGS